MGESPLKGSLKNAKLGTVTLKEKSYRIEAAFEIAIRMWICADLG